MLDRDRNEEDLESSQKERLNALLCINEAISMAYIIKDELKMHWDCKTENEAASFLEAWVVKAMALLSFTH